MPLKRKSLPNKPPKLWGLERLTFSKAIQNVMDADYIDQLNGDEKQWLSTFFNEFYGNTLNKDWRKNLHYKEQLKSIYDQTNARNRDIFNQRYKFNENDQGIPIPDRYSEFTNPENAILELLDKTDKIKKFIKSALDAQTEREFTKKLTEVVFEIE